MELGPNVLSVFMVLSGLLTPGGPGEGPKAAGRLQVLEPLANGDFEWLIEGQGMPAGWNFHISREAKVSLAVDEETVRSGARSVRFTNESGLSPHVYGRFVQSVTVLPGTEYVLSAWVKGEQVAGGQHFTDWKSYSLSLPSGTFDWQEVSTRFQTGSDQTTLDVGLNVVNRAAALWIDHVRLVAAVEPLKSTRPDVQGGLWMPGRVEGDGVESSLHLYLAAPEDFRGTATVRIVGGEDELFHQQQALPGGEDQFEWAWNSGNTPAKRLVCTVSILDAAGQVVAQGGKEIEKVSAQVVRGQLEQVEERFTAFLKLLAEVRETGRPVDYPMVTKTVVEHFLPWAREDVEKGEWSRAAWAAEDLLRSVDRATAELEAYRADPANVPAIARYQTGPVAIDGVSFVGDVAIVKPSRRSGQPVRQLARRPVFFCGYGHFGAVRRDVEIFPDYGINLIQIEFGPSGVLVGENEVNEGPIRDCLSVLDRAARSNVMVNLLLSPHYFPGWAKEKWPHLNNCRGGFLGFCIDAPESRAVIEKFLRLAIPPLKGHPALHSFCLTNEPIYTDSAHCEFTRRKWRDYLRRVHGTVGTMNRRWGTDYTTFAQVPIPGNQDYDAPPFYDWCRFNQERFAGWHRWMADVIHELWPEVPVHAKVMARMFSRNAVADGTDPEMFAELSQINGNDCWNGYPGGGEWAQSWQTQNMYYDLQRSLKPQPIFNSENHLSSDRSTHYYPPGHFRTALWQGAIHGQGATTIWVWERTYDRQSDFYGNVMHRPGCAEAVGRTCLDLNRLAPEVTALQNTPAPAAILYSIPSLIHSENYEGEVGRAYQALNFCGVKVDFVSEKQAAAGKLANYRLLLLPAATHATEAAVRGIAQFVRRGGRLFVLGEEALRYDEYGRARPLEPWAALLKDAGRQDADTRALRAALWDLLEGVNARPALALVEAATGELAWGVEWWVAEQEGGRLVNAVNLTTETVTVRLQRPDGTPVRAVNRLTGGPAGMDWELPPLEPVLWRVED